MTAEVIQIDEQLAKIQERRGPAPGLKMRKEAMIGPLGMFVAFVEPVTEADPAALLITALVAMGNCIGPSSRLRHGSIVQSAVLYAALVGSSSTGRKGTADEVVSRLIRAVDPNWERDCRASGLASGEGLIYRVRDERGKDDPGAKDKRLYLVEPELSHVFHAAERKGSTLLATLRSAWDGQLLSTLAKTTPAVSTGHHISLVSHITPTELGSVMSGTEALSGTANRFLWAKVQRSKVLADAPFFPDAEVNKIARCLQSSIFEARRGGTVVLREDALEIWRAIYPTLSTPPDEGLYGTIMARGPVQVLRLALIYALLDNCQTVCREHLLAACAVFDYCLRSSYSLFGGAGTGNDLADRIIRYLAEGPRSKSEINHGSCLALHR